MDVSVSKSKTHDIINRVRAAIKKLDPSYHLKENGHICAKEWRKIIGEPLDFIWGFGYSEMLRELDGRYSGMDLAKKVGLLRAASKMKIRLNERVTKVDKDVEKYALYDLAMVGASESGTKRQLEVVHFLKDNGFIH